MRETLHFTDMHLSAREIAAIGLLLIALALVISERKAGVGFNTGIPLTDHQITIASSLGTKDAVDALPSYHRRLGDKSSDLNMSGNVTVGPLDFNLIFDVGKHPENPPIRLDAHIVS